MIKQFLQETGLPGYCAGHVFFRAARRLGLEALDQPEVDSIYALNMLSFYAREAGECE